MLTYLHLLGEYLLFFMSTCWKWWFPPHWSRPGRCCHICCCSSCMLFQSRSKWICNKKGSGQVLRRNRDLKQREVVSQSCSRSQFTFLNCGWFSKSLSLPYFKTNLQMLFSCKEKKKQFSLSNFETCSHNYSSDDLFTSLLDYFAEWNHSFLSYSDCTWYVWTLCLAPGGDEQKQQQQKKKHNGGDSTQTVSLHRGEDLW